jgi:hypothetical protein
VFGDPIAANARADLAALADEIAAALAASPGKFTHWRLGDSRCQDETTFRIWLHFDSGDNDEAIIILEEGRWFVADPIHIIR